MIFFIMDCIICLSETKEKSVSKCKCKYNIHKKCYINFLDNSNFLCPVCRKLKKISKCHNDINFIIKLFFIMYFLFILIIYSLILYINLIVFNKFIIKNFF